MFLTLAGADSVSWGCLGDEEGAKFYYWEWANNGGRVDIGFVWERRNETFG